MSSTGSIPTTASRQRLPKRLSQPVPTHLPVLPYTKAEWRRTISEVKREHVSRRYRACAARCTEILESLKDTSQAEPAHLMYLHFYAAASMEMCTRPLPLNSPYRIDLLQQARSHYEQAATLTRSAEDSIALKTRSGSASSNHSSCHSPSGSVSSRTWTADSSSLSSPTYSVCSLEDLTAKSQTSQPRPKRVKKVSFSLPDEEEPFRIPEPFIRPDSPTLGFDDEYFHAGAALKDLPELPKPKVVNIELPLKPEHSILEEDSFVVERSVHRYNEHLSALRAQIASHSSHIDNLLSSRTPQTSDLLASESSRRESTDGSPAGSPSGDLRSLDKQARIARLRKSGWQRKRFDARRYEELCDSVMAELS